MPKADFDVMASRAVEPFFYHAPHPTTMQPKEFQYAGAEYCLARENSILGDEPGVGKTAEAILVGNSEEMKHTLVICPASLRLNWEREIWRWSTIPNVSTYPIFKATDGVSLDANYVIASYNMVSNPSIFGALMEYKWDHLILDEMHAIKDPKGNKRTKAICGWVDGGSYREGLADACGRITGISGTLLPNQPIEAYNAFRLLNFDAIDQMSLESFREHYYEKGGGMVRSPVYDEEKQAWISKLHWSTEVRNVPRNLDDFQYRLRKHLMVRRLKKDVLHELPPKVWHPFPLSVDAKIRKAMKHPGWAEAEKMYEMDPGAFDAGVPVDGAISTARLLLGEAKAPAVADYIDDLMDSGVRKLVVAAWHHTVLEYLYARLKRYGITYMDGRTSDRKKDQAVQEFQNNDKVGIILGQMLPMGEGHTMTAAQDAVLAEPFWVPGKNDQLLDRIHRFGQKGNYLIGHVPVVPGTMDERILNTAISKDQSIHLALDAH